MITTLSGPGLGSRVDRHEGLGKGKLGLTAFGYLMNDPRFDGIPRVLETVDESMWVQEIRLLYGLQRQD